MDDDEMRCIGGDIIDTSSTKSSSTTTTTNHHHHVPNDDDVIKILSSLKEKFLHKQTSLELDMERMSLEQDDEHNMAENEDTTTASRSYSREKALLSRMEDEIELLDRIKRLVQRTKSSSIDEDDDRDEGCIENREWNVELIDDREDIPKSLIVTSLPTELFSNLEMRAQFEQLFTRIQPTCKFCYFRLFKRCCIQFETCAAALWARHELDEHPFADTRLQVSLMSKPLRVRNTRAFLEPPQSDKLFLISPPSSPPVGWQQHYEEPPIVNLDLIAALAKLNPDEPCELIKSSEDTPGIVIHPCPDLEFEPSDGTSSSSVSKRKFMPTRRPANDLN